MRNQPLSPIDYTGYSSDIHNPRISALRQAKITEERAMEMVSDVFLLG